MTVPEAVFFSLFWKPEPTNTRVLSRSTSTHSKASSLEPTDDPQKSMGSRDKFPVDFELELSLLKKQVSSLQISVNSMQRDTEKKEVVLAGLAKDKEQLTVDLKKQKRSNVNLKQQLDDERTFYYKEKEHYCHEMNSYKKLKNRSSNESSVRDYNLENNYKNEISQLKDSLNHALEANYNLSVKFLRMKNTKLCLKEQLGKLKEMHTKAMLEQMNKFEAIKKELDQAVCEQFTAPIPPSNKKYLHVIKQNGTLIHENLCLQLEIDRVHMELDRMRTLDLKNNTNSKLKYIRRSKTESKSSRSVPSTVDSNPVNSKSSRSVPSTVGSNRVNSKTESKSGKSVPSIVDSNRVELAKKDSLVSIEEQKINNDAGVEKEETPPPVNVEKLELMNVSNSNLSSQINGSEMSYYTTLKCQAYRTQSAPEIVHNTDDLT